MATQKSIARIISPPWAQGPNGGAFIDTLGAVSDSLLDKARQGLNAHLPGRGPDSALPYLAEDRRLVQGPAETNAQFIQRLKTAFDSWRRAGSRRSVLEQIQAYLAGTAPGLSGAMPEATIVGGDVNQTVWDQLFWYMAQGAPPQRTVVPVPVNWDWDGVYLPWRAWLVLFMAPVATGQAGTGATVASVGGSGATGVTSGFATLTGLSGLSAGNVGDFITLSGGSHSGNNGSFQIVRIVSASSCVIANRAAVATDTVAWSIAHYPFIAPGPVWGSPAFVWGATTWGLSVDPAVIVSIRQILKRWKSATAYYPNIIISFGGGNGSSGTECSPLSNTHSGNSGLWGFYAVNVNGVNVPGRRPNNPFTAFANGTGEYVQCNSPNVT